MIDIEKLFQKLMAQPVLWFRYIQPAMIPKVEGVYLISVRGEPYYVGRTKNLRRRLGVDHRHGGRSGAGLQKYLVEAGEYKDMNEAKQFVNDKASVRWVEEADLRTRYFLECYATAVLQPKHGVSLEH